MKKSVFTLVLLVLAATGLQAVPFVLKNNSLRSIPLEIPGVMNPNLSPVSISNVDLSVGQKIYFFADGKKGAFKKRYLLLEVTEELAGRQLPVEKLISERKKELGLK